MKNNVGIVEKEIMTIKEAADYLHVSEHSIRKAIKNKEIPFRKFSNKYYFSLQALTIWVAGVNDVQQKFDDVIEKIILEEVS